LKEQDNTLEYSIQNSGRGWRRFRLMRVGEVVFISGVILENRTIAPMA
jgi:hypothetical protein